MLDPESLAAWAEFVRGFAWRLLVYPGGLFVVLPMLLGAWLAQRRNPAHRPLRQTAATFALAVAWTGWALLPLPGAMPLLWTPDMLVVLLLLVAAGLLDNVALGERPDMQQVIARGLLLAAPLIWTLAGNGVALALAGAAYVAGLLTYLRGEFGGASMAGWLLLFSWAALPLALVGRGAATGLVWASGGASGEPWIGMALAGAVLVVAALLAASGVARRLAALAWPWGGLLAAGALLAALL